MRRKLPSTMETLRLGSTWMASQPTSPLISGYFWGGIRLGGGGGWLAIISEDRWCFLFRSLKHERMMEDHIFVDHWNWAILKMACQQLQTVFLVAELCCWIFWIICFRHESLRIVRVVSQVSFHFWAPSFHPGPIIRNWNQNKQTSMLLCRSGLCGRVRRRKSKVKSLQFVLSAVCGMLVGWLLRTFWSTVWSISWIMVQTFCDGFIRVSQFCKTFELHRAFKMFHLPFL